MIRDRALIVVFVLALCVAAGTVCPGAEKDIALSKVPGKVLAAAKAAVPGITLTEAEVESTDKGVVYELEGVLAGSEYEIKVSADGKVLRIKQEVDDDDGENEDEDDG